MSVNHFIHYFNFDYFTSHPVIINEYNHSCVDNVLILVVPDTPSDVSLDTFADTVKLGWKPPKQPGIKNYTVTYYPQDDPTNKKTKTIPADEREAFITDKDMDPQKYYTFEVQANNDDGKGKPWRMEGVVIGDPDGKFMLSYVFLYDTLNVVLVYVTMFVRSPKPIETWAVKCYSCFYSVFIIYT